LDAGQLFLFKTLKDVFEPGGIFQIVWAIDAEVGKVERFIVIFQHLL